MNKLNTYKNTTLALIALTMGMTLMGCAEDAGLYPETAQQLSVTPLVESSMGTRATIPSDSTLNEDKLNNLNVKIYDGSTCKVDKTFTADVASNKQEVVCTGNWKVDKGLTENQTYTVKAVANYTGTDDTLTDADIWKPYDATNNKTFLMSSVSEYKVTGESTQNIPVQLERAAAKIVVKLHVNVDGYTPGVPQWQLKNYNAKTTVFGENTATDIKEGTMTASQGEKGEYTFTTYSYAMTWTDADKAPSLYIKLALTDADGNTEMNYYSIPVRDPKATAADAKSLARNTLYTIDATINSKGGSSEVEYIESGKVVYDVLAWSDGGNTRIDANTSYLMVYPQTVYMRNVEDDTSVTYKSSSAVTIKSKKVYYVDNEGNTVEYTQGQPEFYPSKYNKKGEATEYEKRVYPYPQTIALTQDAGGGDNLSGKITIKSTIPQNRFAKYIKLVLQNEDGKEVTVIYKQSPLIETQSFEGYYSSRSTAGWVTPYTEGTNKDFEYDKHNKRYGYYAKYYKNGHIYTFEKDKDDSNTNNRMYVIQVSSTKDSKYKVAHASTGTNGYTTDEVVSPAFMIASQLGAVYSEAFDQDKALTHCKTYREVAKEDGKEVIYDGWRLPTKTEIQFIVDFQKESFKTNSNQTKQPIEPVLQGAKYYTLNNESVSTGYGGGGTYVRCVRDLTPAEVDKLDKQTK